MLKKKPVAKKSTSSVLEKKPSLSKRKPTQKKSTVDSSVKTLNFKVYSDLFVVSWWIYLAISLCLFLFVFLWIVEFDDMVEGAVYSLDIILGLAFLIIFIIWLYNNYKYLHNLGVERLSYNPWWAIRWRFIPIVSWIIPYKIMKDIFLYHSWVHKPSDDKGSHNINLLFWWWILYIVSNLFFRFSEDGSVLLLAYIAHLFWIYFLMRVVQKIYILQTN